MCGTKYNDQYRNVEVTFAHSLYTTTLEFSSNVNEHANNESWGIRDFYIYTDVIDSDIDSNKPVYSAFTTATINKADIAGWTINKPKSKNLITTCGKDQMFGGYNVFGVGSSAILNVDLNPHYEITIALNFFKLDSWDNEVFLLFVDGA